MGCVTASCVADAGYQTIGLDPDGSVIAGLNGGRAPLFEPELDDLIQRGMERANLTFTTDFSSAQSCDLVWVAFDTPVDDNDLADSGFVISAVERVFPYLKDDAVLLISSQLPVGTTRAVAEAFHAQYPQKTCHFAYSPENLRLGKAIEVFKNAERIVVGSESERVRQLLQPILDNFTQQVVWVSVNPPRWSSTASMRSLRTCVTFANETRVDLRTGWGGRRRGRTCVAARAPHRPARLHQAGRSLRRRHPGARYPFPQMTDCGPRKA